MAETNPGINDLLNLLGSAAPLAALTKNIDSLKKGVESFVGAVSTFTRTMEALEQATHRISALLEEIEAPVRNVAGQLSALPPQAIAQAVNNLNVLSTQMAQLVGPLSGVAGIASGFLAGVRAPADQASTSTPPVPRAGVSDTNAKTAPRKRTKSTA